LRKKRKLWDFNERERERERERESSLTSIHYSLKKSISNTFGELLAKYSW
jgi:hypothetical protein